MGLGGLISYGSRGLQSLALANNITKMNAFRSAIYATGLAIQKNIPPILGTFEAYSEASTGTEQVKKSIENQINSFYHNSINNYLYDSLGKIVGNDTNKLLPILEEMGSSNYDENVLMKYGINPIEFKKVIAEAEYNREIQNEQLGNELLKNFAITFGINSIINGFANHYILSPL